MNKLIILSQSFSSFFNRTVLGTKKCAFRLSGDPWKARDKLLSLYGQGHRNFSIKNANLSKANLTGADLIETDLKGANLTNAILDEVRASPS